MRKSVLLAGLAALVVVLLTGWTFQPAVSLAAGDVVKIGLSAPLTGDWAEYGNDFKRSCQMVVDRINRMGGIHGKQVELVIEDSRGDPKEAVLIAEKFVANPDIIAEIGVNHNGILAYAFELIDASVEAGADAVKFQKRNLENCTQKSTSTILMSARRTSITYCQFCSRSNFQTRIISRSSAIARKRALPLCALPLMRIVSILLNPWEFQPSKWPRLI